MKVDTITPMNSMKRLPEKWAGRYKLKNLIKDVKFVGRSALSEGRTLIITDAIYTPVPIYIKFMLKRNAEKWYNILQTAILLKEESGHHEIWGNKTVNPCKEIPLGKVEKILLGDEK